VGTTTTFNYTYFILGNDLTTVTSSSTFTPTTVVSGTGFGSLAVSLSGTIAGSTAFNYLANSPSFYEVISSTSLNFA
jgi:hypothetical protein